MTQVTFMGSPVQIGGQIQPGWGLHLVDVNIAQGDLIRAVQAQGAAWLSAHRTGSAAP